MNRIATSPRALMVVAEPRARLARVPGLLRAAGLRVDVLGNAAGPLGTSVCIDRFFRCPVREIPQRLREHLTATNNKPYSWVSLCDEGTLDLLAPHHGESWLAPIFPVPMNGVAEKIISSKAAFTRACQQHGVPMPSSIVCDDESALREAFATIKLPVMLKHDRGAAGQGVRRLDSPSDLEKALRELPRGPWILQQFIDGQVGSTQMLMHNGRVVRWFASMKYEVWPEPFGPSASRKLVNHPKMLDCAEGIARMTGFTGLCGMDWMLDAAGNLFVLEFNSRPTSVYNVGKFAGVDFAGGVRDIIAGRTPSRQDPAWEDDGSDIVYLWPQYAIRALSRGKINELAKLMPFGRNDLTFDEPKMLWNDTCDLMRRVWKLGKKKVKQVVKPERSQDSEKATPISTPTAQHA